MKTTQLIFLALIVLKLLSCGVINKITQEPQTCVEYLCVYDSCDLVPNPFWRAQTMVIYGTDNIDKGCLEIWAKECNFKPGDSLWVKQVRYYSPGHSGSYWKAFLINKYANNTKRKTYR